MLVVTCFCPHEIKKRAVERGLRNPEGEICQFRKGIHLDQNASHPNGSNATTSAGLETSTLLVLISAQVEDSKVGYKIKRQNVKWGEMKP